MTRFIPAGPLSGTVPAPPSKSMAHRYLICAALAEGESAVHHLSPSQDILATVDCLSALGATLRWEGDTVYVRGIRAGCSPLAPLDCRECGTTLRLLLPLCLLGGGEATLVGTERLLSRPLAAYEALCRERGFLWEQAATSVRVCGRLTAGDYTLPGDVSSQYVSGMLYALASVTGNSRIHLTGQIESRSYIDLTLSALATFGVSAGWVDGHTLSVTGGQAFSAREVTVEGDWSNAAFWLAWRALGEDLTVTHLSGDSLQGDRACLSCFEHLTGEEHPVLSLADCPDLGPVLMAVAALTGGATLTDTARLKLKESDRGQAMAAELAKCGVCVTVEENRITVNPTDLHAPTAPLSGHNDHRIVMALCLLANRLGGGEVTDCEAVRKSYPDFFEQLNSLGIKTVEKQ
ncbi:MAG: 3-phosphoshikimate 1-carboxyvinyltransferase [Clostridia bacterium]|nr:3-phosphoshikimate 1-carboxyvinyltransferase [Clostridia bacterium]